MGLPSARLAKQGLLNAFYFSRGGINMYFQNTIFSPLVSLAQSKKHLLFTTLSFWEVVHLLGAQDVSKHRLYRYPWARSKQTHSHSHFKALSIEWQGQHLNFNTLNLIFLNNLWHTKSFQHSHPWLALLDYAPLTKHSPFDRTSSNFGKQAWCYCNLDKASSKNVSIICFESRHEQLRQMDDTTHMVLYAVHPAGLTFRMWGHMGWYKKTQETKPDLRVSYWLEELSLVDNLSLFEGTAEQNASV